MPGKTTIEGLCTFLLVSFFLLHHVSSFVDHGNSCLIGKSLVNCHNTRKVQARFASNKKNVEKDSIFRVSLQDSSESLEENGNEFSQAKPVEDNVWLWRSSVVVCAALWGSNFVVIKALLGEDGSDASLNAAARFIIAAVSLSPFLFKAKSADELIQGFEVGVYIAIGYIFQALGLITTDANKSTFICSMQVVTVALATCYANKKLDVKSVSCTLLGISGVAFLQLLGAEKQFVIGDLYSVGMPVFWGLSYILIGKYSPNLKDKNAKLAFSAAQLLPVALISTLWACFDSRGIPDLLSIFTSTSSTAAILYSGIISTGLSVILQTYAFEKIPASEASILVVTEPIWAAVLAFFFLGERMGSSDIIGASFILSACFLNEVPSEKLERMIKFREQI